ncbi:hypothetical protein GCM10025734_36220 [Kitasatospora paranensis]
MQADQDGVLAAVQLQDGEHVLGGGVQVDLAGRLAVAPAEAGEGQGVRPVSVRPQGAGERLEPPAAVRAPGTRTKVATVRSEVVGGPFGAQPAAETRQGVSGFRGGSATVRVTAGQRAARPRRRTTACRVA